MKIEQLISAVNESVNNEAFADLARKEKEMAANRTAPVTKPAPNLTVVPGGKGTGVQTQQATNPVSFGKGTAMPINPVTVPGAGTSAVPATTPTTAPTTQPAPTQSAGPSAVDRLKQAAGTVGSAIKTGAQAVAKNAPAVGQGVSNVAQGLGSAGTGIVKGVGDIASQAIGGAAQTVGAGLGGAVHGYKAARAGQQFGGGGTAGSPGVSAPSPQSAAGADAGGNDELAQLKSTLQTMDQRLRRAGI